MSDAGELVLTSDVAPADRATTSFTTGAVNTWGKAAWRAGDGTFRVCVSARLPGVSGGSAGTASAGSQGLWPAHWLMPHDNSCDPDEGEMDIMEMVNGDGLYEATYHWQTGFPVSNCSYPEGHGHQFTSHPLGAGWNSTFHEFAVERGVGHVAFALDGAVRLNVTKQGQPSATAPAFWDVPWYLILNTAVGGGWPGPPSNQTIWPARHVIDYVRVVQQQRT